MCQMKPNVVVVMSTYNGEKYIGEQIDSILLQRDVDVQLYIRDDGSNDTTRIILSEYANNNKIHVEYGDNVGYKASFMLALLHAPIAEYYCFSDQDDVWDQNKLIKCIRVIENKTVPALAFSNSYETDEYLKITNNLYPPNRAIPFYGMTFISPVAHGFLMVFNNELRQIVQSMGFVSLIPHDLWIGAIASYTGDIEYVNELLAKHRRLSTSLSRYNWKQTIRNRIRSIKYDQGTCIECAQKMRLASEYISPEKRQILDDIENYRCSLAAKWRLIKNNRMSYTGVTGWLAIKIKILINRF